MSVPKLTKEQAAIIGVYTGYSTSNFSIIQEKCEQLLGRPVFTHELTNDKLFEQLQELVKPEFLAICCE